MGGGEGSVLRIWDGQKSLSLFPGRRAALGVQSRDDTAEKSVIALKHSANIVNERIKLHSS